MSYSWLCVVALLGSTACDVLVLKTFLLRRKAFWMAYAILFVFQLLVNGLLTGLRIVRYDPGAITGLRLAYAPIEDLGFGFALILLTLSCWVWLNRRAADGEQGMMAR
jgi:lycopene cyclase domain-containing protein